MNNIIIDPKFEINCSMHTYFKVLHQRDTNVCKYNNIIVMVE